MITVLLKNRYLPVSRLKAGWYNDLGRFAARELGVDIRQLKGVELISCSTDSRSGNPKFLLTLKVELDGGVKKFRNAERLSAGEAAALAPPELEIPENPALENPIVIGTGPAGISAALVLAMAGCRPVIIDRGQPVGQRVKDYQHFLVSRELDENSNLLIGEGGAGTFSDGKLYTGTKDILGRYLKYAWVEAGAPQEILWRSRAHIGSDNLPRTAENLRRRIEELGGEFRFGTNVENILVSSGRCVGVILDNGEKLYAPAVFFAPGLGGRKLVRNVCEKVQWQFKPFQSGCRIIHPQQLIDRAMYHLPSRPEALGAAEYHLTARRSVLPVSSFCMCPGGTVVNASAWRGHLISNGMSEFARGREFANSCLIATLDPADFGGRELFERFEKLERDVFEHGGSDYTFPAQDAAAFIAGKKELRARGNGCDTAIVPAEIDKLLPEILRDALRGALTEIDRRVHGFISEGYFAGAESFVSSPIRLLRDADTLQSPDCQGLYPMGEGCGLAGGIVSAGCDGMRCALRALKEK